MAHAYITIDPGEVIRDIEHYIVRYSIKFSYDCSKWPVRDHLPRTGRVVDLRLISVVHSSLITRYEHPLSTADRYPADGVACATEWYIDEIFMSRPGAMEQPYPGAHYFPPILIIISVNALRPLGLE